MRSFFERTGCPVLVNTSFNVRGEPIVCTPEDAYRCFLGTEMDVLVLEDVILLKTDVRDGADVAAARSTSRSSSSTRQRARPGVQDALVRCHESAAEKTLRQFAGLCLVVFGGLAAWRMWRQAADGPAIALVAVGAVWRGRPGPAVVVRPIFTGWMMVAFPIGWAVSRVALGICSSACLRR